MAFEVSDAAVVNDVIIGNGDRATFFHFFNFAIVAFANSVGVEGALGAFRDAFVTEGFGRDDGDDGEGAREFVLKGAIFGPGVDAVEDDLALAGGDERFSLFDSLAGDPILALGFADHFAEGFFAFPIRGALDAAFSHFLVNHVAEMDFWITFGSQMVDGDGFASAAHADDGDEFKVGRFIHKIYYSMVFVLVWLRECVL